MRHSYLVVIAVLVQLGHGLTAAGEQMLTMPLPRRVPLISSSTIRCETLAQSTIEDAESAASVQHAASRITARVGRGQDKVVLNVAGDKLTFLTQAAFDSGAAVGTEFQVLVNDQRHLMAVHASTSPQPMLNSLVIHRREALAVWTKTRADSLFSTAPDAATMYLVCR